MKNRGRRVRLGSRCEKY